MRQIMSFYQSFGSETMTGTIQNTSWDSGVLIIVNVYCICSRCTLGHLGQHWNEVAASRKLSLPAL
jgi:hypothetical protein